MNKVSDRYLKKEYLEPYNPSFPIDGYNGSELTLKTGKSKLTPEEYRKLQEQKRI